MHFLTLTTLLTLIQYLFFGALVAKARQSEQVSAPAVQGSLLFNTLHRVHQNTLERLIVFLPLLWMAAQFWSAPVIAAWGSLFLVARFQYWKGYVKGPADRKTGNILTMVVIAVLLVANLAGVVRSLSSS
jgi:glutathione S-transferase